jgi:hypothetical protein
MSTELRPLSLGELLDRTFTYYREHFWTFVGIMAPAQIVVIAANVVVQAFMHPAAPVGTSTANPAQALALLVPFYAAMTVSVVVGSIAHAVALAASSTAVSKFHLGGNITIKEAYQGLSGSIARLAGLYGLLFLITIGTYALLMVGMVFFAGFAALVGKAFGAAGAVMTVVLGFVIIVATLVAMVLAFVLLLRFALSIPALVLEHLGPVRALRRSSFLAKGSVGRIFLACVLMYLIVLVVGFTFEAPFLAAGLLMGYKFNHNPLWLNAPTVIAGGIGSALSYPILTIVLPLFYYEARVRKEGFDLQVMMSAAAPERADSGIVADSALPLPTTSVALTIVLTVLTLGFYVPVWYLNRVAALNRLDTRERLDKWAVILALALLVASVVLALVVPLGHIQFPAALNIARLLSLAGSITLLVQAFKVRRMIEERINARARAGGLFAQPEALNGVAVFFFHIWYLQYKINELFGLIYENPPSLVDGGAVLEPGPASGPPL